MGNLIFEKAILVQLLLIEKVLIDLKTIYLSFIFILISTLNENMLKNDIGKDVVLTLISFPHDIIRLHHQCIFPLSLLLYLLLLFSPQLFISTLFNRFPPISVP